MAAILLLAVCVGMVFGAPQGSQSEFKNVDFLMPEVQPDRPDTYLCSSMKLNRSTEFIVGFEPHANTDLAHNIQLYGCKEPGSSASFWYCGDIPSTHGVFPVCKSGATILSAWRMDATPIRLPVGVGFKVGGNSGINYLVMQVHYKDVTTFLPPKNGKDSSGITLRVTQTPQRRRAGIFVLGTGGEIPPHSTVYMETACYYNGYFDIRPFAFSIHARALGQVISGYRIRDGKWAELGRESPKSPKVYYNTTIPGSTVMNGDILAARCTMVNNKDRTVHIGSTQNDEACNFYFMYYVEGDHTIERSSCFSEGPPSYTWQTSGPADMNLENIPKTASVVPGTDTVLNETIFADAEYSPHDNAIDEEAQNDGNDNNDSLDPSVFASLEEFHQLQESEHGNFDNEECHDTEP